MHFVTCSQRQSGNLKRQQPPIIVSTKQFQYLKLLLYLLNIIIILYFSGSTSSVLDYGNGFTLLFNQTKKITRCVLCFLKSCRHPKDLLCIKYSIKKLRNKNTSSDTLYPGCQRLFQRGLGTSGTQGRYSIKLNKENKMYISKAN